MPRSLLLFPCTIRNQRTRVFLLSPTSTTICRCVTELPQVSSWRNPNDEFGRCHSFSSLKIRKYSSKQSIFTEFNLANIPPKLSRREWASELAARIHQSCRVLDPLVNTWHMVASSWNIRSHRTPRVGMSAHGVRPRHEPKTLQTDCDAKNSCGAYVIVATMCAALSIGHKRNRDCNCCEENVPLVNRSAS